MFWRKCEKLLTNAQGKVINCDFCPCPVYVVIGIVEQPLDSNWEIIPCQNAYCYHTTAHIVDGHFCWQYRPQKQVEIAFHKPHKDETVFEADIEEWAGHNRNHVKVYFLSDCYQDYNEFLLMYNDVPQGETVQSYWDNKARGKRLAWKVICDWYGVSFGLDTPYCFWDDNMDFMTCGFFAFSGSDGNSFTVPYPNGLFCDDPVPCNPLFQAGLEQIEDAIQALGEDRETYGVVYSENSENLCPSFSYSFSGGCWSGGAAKPSYFWDNAGFAYFIFQKPEDITLNAKGVKFRYGGSILTAYFGQQFKPKQECWGVDFAGSFSVAQDQYQNDYLTYFSKDGNMIFDFQLIDYVWE